MLIDITQQQAFTVATVNGRLDASNAQDFEKQMSTVIEQGKKDLIFDFAGLEYISSAGLRAILATAKKARKLGGNLSLCAVTGLVQEVISVSGFDSFLPIFGSLDEAVNSGK